jgi:hypothetical protein
MQCSAQATVGMAGRAGKLSEDFVRLVVEICGSDTEPSSNEEPDSPLETGGASASAAAVEEAPAEEAAAEEAAGPRRRRRSTAEEAAAEEAPAEEAAAEEAAAEEAAAEEAPPDAAEEAPPDWSEEAPPDAAEEAAAEEAPSAAAAEEALPPKKYRRAPPTDAERLEAAAERTVAEAFGLSWQERGPPGPSCGGPQTWRGQQFREGSGKWANRGGRNQEYYRLVDETTYPTPTHVHLQAPHPGPISHYLGWGGGYVMFLVYKHIMEIVYPNTYPK